MLSPPPIKQGQGGKVSLNIFKWNTYICVTKESLAWFAHYWYCYAQPLEEAYKPLEEAYKPLEEAYKPDSEKPGEDGNKGDKQTDGQTCNYIYIDTWSNVVQMYTVDHG